MFVKQRIFKRARMAVAILLGSATMTLAQPVLYECDMTDMAASGGWISEKVVFVMVPSKKAAILFAPDYSNVGGPSEPQGKIARFDNEVAIANWYLKGISDSFNTRVQNFRVSIRVDQATKKIQVQAKPKSYANNWRASGTCTIENLKVTEKS